MANIPTHEYSWYFDTNNRERVPSEELSNNPTNHVMLPTRLANQKLQVQSLRLASLEMPLAQFTIEEKWNRLYFDEGLNLMVTAESQVPLTQFVIDENGIYVTAQLPPHLNPIVAVDVTTPTAPIFTTTYPHGLDIRASYDWGESIQLIGTLLTGNDTIIDNTTSVTIVDETNFQITGVAAVAYTSTSGNFGFVWAPVIPSPVYLAQLITASLENQASNHWRVTYDTDTTKFTLCWTNSGCAARDVSPATLIIPSASSLPALMGFGTVSISIPLPAAETRAFETDMELITRRHFSEPSPTCLVASGCYLCKSHIKLNPQNYDPSALGGSLSLQWNRFYFEPGCDASSPPVTYVFYFSSSCGVCHNFSIAPGLYSPETLAAYIQTQMNIADATNTYTVTYNSTDGTFTLAGTDPFGLDFDLNAENLPSRLGFDPICYRNGNSYTSNNPFHVPTKGCCGTALSERYLSYVYSPLLSTNERSFIINLCNRRCSNASTAVDNGDGTMTITFIQGATNVAHGFQVGDVIRINNGTDTYYLRVTVVNGWNTFTVDLGSVPFTEFSGGNDPGCICPAQPVVGNLYFSSRCKQYTPNMLPSRLLGFGSVDMLWAPGFNGFESTGNFDFDWPSYVLVEIDDPQHGTSRNEHSWVDGDTETHKYRILAKMLLYPQLRMERVFPMNLEFPSLSWTTLRRLRLRILNPDHSLYQFHHRNWSGTIVFNVVQGQPVGPGPVPLPLHRQ